MSEGWKVVKLKIVDFDCVIFNVMINLHAPFRD